MADRYVATDGYDGNTGTSTSDAYASLETAMNDGSVGAGDTIWMVVANPGEKFTSEVGTVTADIQGTNGGGGVSIRGTNASGVVDGTMAIIDFAGVSVVNGGIDFVTSGWFVQNIAVENVDTGTTQHGFYLLHNLFDAPFSDGGSVHDFGYATFLGCAAYNCGVDGFRSDHQFPLWVQCYSANNGANGFRVDTGEHNFYGCIAEDNTTSGFSLGADGSCFFCIANDNGSDGILNPVVAINCTCDNNGSDGISIGSEPEAHVIANNIVSNNGQYGIDNTQTFNPEGALYLNNAFYNNDIDEFRETRKYWEHEEGSITLTEDPYMNHGYRDFSLNGRKFGGILCRAAAQSFTNKHPNTLSFLDVGALQTKMRGIVAS